MRIGASALVRFQISEWFSLAELPCPVYVQVCPTVARLYIFCIAVLRSFVAWCEVHYYCVAPGILAGAYVCVLCLR